MGTVAIRIFPLILMPLVAFAAEDSFQLEGAVNYEATDFDGNTDLTQFGIRGRYYLDPLSRAFKDFPLAETQFVQRIPSVEGTFGRYDLEVGTGLNIEADGFGFGAGMEYLRPGQPYTVSAEFLRADLDVSGGAGNADISNYAIGVGRYLDEVTHVKVSFERMDLEVQGGGAAQMDQNVFSVSGKHLWRSPAGNYVNLEAEAQRQDNQGGNNWGLGVLADFYFDQFFSAGAGFEYNFGSDDAVEGMTFSADIGVFLRNDIKVDFGIEMHDADAPNGDYDSLTIDVLKRF